MRLQAIHKHSESQGVGSSRTGLFVSLGQVLDLSGLSFAVKDLYDVAGYPTGCGSPVMRAESGVAEESAPAVQKLLDAGATFAGKTHTAEMAYSLDGVNAHYGTPTNPAAPDRVPGGSSSGSAAAVAAGLVDFALGSDTGGSVRGPASFCGIIGLRPTQDRIDISRTSPLAQSLDTVGWFTRTIDLYERIAPVMLGEDATDKPLQRLIVPQDMWASVARPAVREALRPAMDRFSERYPSDSITVAEHGLGPWQDAFRTIQGYEAWRNHGDWVARNRDRMMPQVYGRFAAGRDVSPEAFDEATALRRTIAERLRSILGNDGFIAVSTMPDIAPLVAASDADLEAFRSRALSMLCVAGLAGLPQISLPVASLDGAPLGLSLIGPPGRDRALIRLGRELLTG